MEEKPQEEPQYIKIISSCHKGVQLPDDLKWVTVNPKSHKLTETMLKLEIEGIENSIQKLSDELSMLRKRKIKENTAIEVVLKELDPKKIKVLGEAEKLILDEQPRKKYQKSKRICPCCNVVVIRHFCPHTACEKDCPIKLAYLKKKMKMDTSKN